MAKAPNARSTTGQEREDHLDAVAEEMSRRTTTWIRQTLRAHPGDEELATAVMGGIAGALVSDLLERNGHDPDKTRAGWSAFVDGFIEAMEEDQSEKGGQDE